MLQAIDRDKYDVVPIGISTSGHWVLESGDLERLSITTGKLPEVDVTRAAPCSSARTATLVSEPARYQSNARRGGRGLPARCTVPG